MTVFLPTGTGRTGTTQDFTVPSTADYALTAVGAAGGDAHLQGTTTLNPGGAGASMYGEFALTAGDVIRFMVGQKGGNPSQMPARGGGGGGATFVYNVTTSTLLMVAGGGGGGGQYANGTLKRANLTANGSGGTAGNAGVGGVAPNGGNASLQYAGGGGGYSGNGGSAATFGQGGLSYTNGGTGGAGYTDGAGGGYGGGGGSYAGAGGGGGYGGGGGGGWAYSGDGGGGGSFNGGINQTNTTGVGTAAGSAEIVGLNALPNAPTILTPADNATVALTSGVDFTYIHNDPDGDAQVGYALKRRAVTLGLGIIHGADEWWSGTAWVGTETIVASTSQPISTSGWPVSGDTYQYRLATSDAGGLGAYSNYRTLNPYEWWSGTAWVTMVESYVASTASEATLSANENGLIKDDSYDWTVSTKDSSSAFGPYASMFTFTATGSLLARIWNGTAWIDHDVLVRETGGTWLKRSTIVWDGTTWIES